MIAFPSPSKPKDVYRDLLQENPDAMVIVGFEEAYIGMTVTSPVVAIYDYEGCLKAIVDDRNCCESEGNCILIEIISECVHPESPIFVRCP